MNDRLIPLSDLCIRLGGLSRASIYRHVRHVPGFPQPVKVGRSTRFRESDVQAFIAEATTRTSEGVR